MRWLLVPLALVVLLRPLSVHAGGAVWVAPAETPGAAGAEVAGAGCDPLTLWLDAPAGDGTWALRPVAGAGAVPELLGTWHSPGGLAPVAGGIAPYAGSYLLTVSGGVTASRVLTVDCPGRGTPAATVAAAPPLGGPVPIADTRSAPAPAPDYGPGLVGGCLLVTVALMLSGWRRASSGAGA